MLFLLLFLIPVLLFAENPTSVYYRVRAVNDTVGVSKKVGRLYYYNTDGKFYIANGSNLDEINNAGSSFTKLITDQFGENTIIVGTDANFTYNTVDAAINAASVGQTILVLPGTYTGNIDADVDSIAIVSLMGAENTTLDITMVSSAGLHINASRVVIDGFTITETTGSAGALIEIQSLGDNSIIKNNIINTIGTATFGTVVTTAGNDNITWRNNIYTSDSGDGCNWVNKGLTNSVFLNNTFFGQDSTSGYAIQAAGFSNIQVKGNIITTEKGIDGGFASGIFFHTATSGPAASDSVWILNNQVSNCSKGIRIGHTSQTANIDYLWVNNNEIYNNSFGVWNSPDANNLPATFELVGNNIHDNVTAGIRSTHATAIGISDNNIDGNRGVGTTAPDAKLHSLATTTQLELGYDLANKATFTVADDGLMNIVTVDPDGAEADITFNPDGNFGIGVTNPSRILEVSDNQPDTRVSFINNAVANVNNILYNAFALNTDVQQRSAGWIRTSFTDITDATRTSLMEIGTTKNGSISARISILGDNVGIGTAAPNAKLAINGTLSKGIHHVNESTHTLDGTAHFIAVNYTATGAVTLTLPEISTTYFQATDSLSTTFEIMDTGANANTNNITINRGGSDTIITTATGQTSAVMSGDGDSIKITAISTTVWKVH